MIVFGGRKVSLYDKNQEAHRFGRDADLTERQAEQVLFGSKGSSSVLNDIDDEDAIDFLFGQGGLSLDEGGVLKVPKPEPLEIGDNNQRCMYRARVLEGDLPFVPVAPVPQE